MKQSIIWLTWLTWSVLTAFGQGTVNFANRATGTLDAPVFDLDGTTKLAGTAYRAQLYGGAVGGTLQPVGAPLAFRTGIGAGYFDPASDPNGTTRMIPGVAEGGTAQLQVRAWEVAKGATYDAALANGGKTGASPTFTLATGGGLNPPVTLVGLASFRLQLSGPPKIDRQPVSVVTGVGGTARFEVTASGPQPYRYQWRKGPSNLGGATTAVLTIQPVAAADAGSYIVRVSNDFGFIDSSPAQLTIAPAPVITGILVAPNPPRLGQPLRLEAVAEGTGPITYQWYRGTTPIPGATAAVLNLATAEAGTYSIRVTGPGGTSSRDAATVTAEYVLEVVTSVGGSVAVTPSRTTYAAGTSVTLQATAQAGYAFGGWSGDLTGIANPATLVMDSHKHVEAGFRPTGGTVVLANRASGIGLDAPVFDIDGTTKLDGPGFVAQLYAGPTAATLAPIGEPVPFRTGVAAGYITGADRSIPTVTAGSPAFAQIRAWAVSAGATYEAAVAARGKAGSSTVVTVITGNAGTPPSLPGYLLGLQSFRLQLGAGPSITQQPLPVTIGLGGTATFEVVASGTSPLTYQWRKGTQNLPGANASILRLSPVTAADAGTYLVRVTNVFGAVESSAVALTIVPAPVISDLLIAPNPPVFGRALRLEAVVAGTGPFTYRWQLNQNDIPGGTAAVLNLAAAEAGTYRVLVGGPGGTTTRDAVTVTAQYVLELVAGTGGTIRAEPAQASYAAGTRVTLTATPDAGYGFGGWSGDLAGTTTPISLVMDGHKHVEASFRPTGGTVVLANRASGIGLDAPVFDIDGTTKLDGPGYVAQLYAGPTAETLTPIGDPVPFRTGVAAGYITSADRSIPAVPPGAVATVQIRAWAVSAGATYEAAVAARGKAGSSAVLTVITGNAGTPPSLPGYPLGLQSFRLQLGAGPSITRQPLPVTIGLGGTATFEVVASGTSPLTYQWRKGTQNLPGANASILRLSPVTAADAGTYLVRVTNVFGAVESSAVALTIVPAPVISDLLIAPNPPVFGRALRLEAVVAGTGPFTYRWQLNQNDIPGATAAVLNLAAAEAGTYRVLVGGPGGTTTRDAVTVTAQYVLELAAGTGGTVRVEPAQATYAAGTRVTLTASPDAGYAFGGWSGDLSGTTTPISLVMDGHKHVDASFRPTAGTVYFANRVLSASLDAPVFDSDGFTRLAGPGYLAQLYGGPTAETLTPAGAPVPFRSEPGAEGYFSPADRSIPGITPGALAALQVRVWVASDGATYEAALAKGGKVGASTILTLPTGNVGTPPSLPTYLAGLQSFKLGPGLPPRIVEVRVSPTPLVARPLRLEAIVEGSGPYTFEWRLGGQVLAGATGAVYETQSAAPGTYRVQVTGPGGSAGRDALTLLPEYVLELVPGVGGSLTADPSQARYAVGASVTVTAVPEPAYAFGSWAGDLAGSANPARLVMDGHKHVEALFRPTGGTVYFANRVTSANINAPVFDIDGITPLSGGDFLARLYAGPTADSLVPVGRPLPFRTGVAAGFVDPEDRSLPNVPPGGVAAVQLRAWARGAGETYEEAVLAGGHAGSSAIIQVVTGNAGSPPTLPAYLLGLRSFSLQSGQAPQITTPPAALTVVAGRPARFEVVATGLPAPAYQWRKNDNDIPGATSRTLEIPAARSTDAGLYSVRVTNRLGGVTSSPVPLVVLEPPVILTLTPATTCFAGESVRLEVRAGGTAPWNYQWYVGEPGDAAEPVGSDAPAFQTSSLVASTAFWVRVRNAAGTIDSPAIPVTVERRAQTLEFGPLAAVRYGTTPIPLTARASSGLPVQFTLLSGPAVLGAQALTPTGVGTVRLRATQPGDSRFLPAPPVEAELRIEPAAATVVLADLEQTFNNFARPIRVVTTPANLAFSVTYADSATPPVAAGSYPVTATITDPNYTGTASGVLLVRRATATLALQRLEQNYDGLPKSIGTSVQPAGLLVRVTYNGLATLPVAEGEYAVDARVEDPNYQGSTSGTLRIVAVLNIAGRVFRDLNSDGLADSGETGLPGVPVRLLGMDGTTVLRSVVTDDAGAYAFRGVASGSYYLAEVTPAGYTSTTPDLRLIAVNGQAVTEVDFGDQPVGGVTGLVFEDLDGNGFREAGEQGIGGVVIRLLGGAGQRTTTTVGDGSFAFADVEAGTYSVEELDPVGYSSTTPNLRTVSVAAGGAAAASFGDQAAGTVSGLVFEDLNGNGTPESGEPGLPGVNIRLGGANGQRTTATSESGAFSFAQVFPGTYTVEETDPVGFSSTSPNSRTVSIASGGAATASFGDQAAGSVTGLVFEDRNGNGIPEKGELGLGGVGLRLVGDNTQRVTTTDADGAYLFAGVEPGLYRLEETDPVGFSSTSPNIRNVSLGSGGAATANFGDQAAGSIAGLVFADTDGNGLREPGESGLGGVVIRLVGPDGQRQGVTSGDGTYQFTALLPGAYSVEEIDPPGFASTTPNLRAVHLGVGGSAAALFGDQPVQTISGLVFEDQNGNGQPDAGEPGVGGVKVLLLRSGEDTPYQDTLTSGNGGYVFANVPAGNYTVRQDVPDLYTVIVRGPSVPAPHALPGAPDFVDRSVRLAEGGAASASFGINVAGQLSGVVFNDLDGNGTPTAGEPGLGGARIEVRHPDTGGVLASTTSSGNGVYLVPALPAGTYVVAQIAPPGYLAATAPTRVTLGIGGAATANFANLVGGTVSGRAFNDENANGLRDATEPGLGGIRIALLRTGTTPTETVTAGDGSFLFTDVAPGDLQLQPAVPDGFHATTPIPVSLALAPQGALGASLGFQSDSVRPPTLVAEPADLILPVGGTAEFSALAEGTEPLSYQWLRNGTPIQDETRRILSLPAVQTTDEALYQVRVSNPVGLVVSRAARLTVGVADPFAAWVAGQGLPADLRRPADDPDHDGLPNLLEFVLGTHPGSPTADGLLRPAEILRDGLRHLGFELVRSRSAAAVRLFLESSDDLVTWSESPATVVLQGTEAGGDRLRIVDDESLGSRSHRFLRLAAAVGSPVATPATLRLISGPPITTGFRLALEGQPGTTYTLEWSVDLRTWTFLQNAVAASTPVVVTDPGVAGITHRFYRAVAR